MRKERDSMKIATYNIAAGQYCHQDLGLLSKMIDEQEIDVLGVQEVDNKTGRSQQVNQIEALKSKEKTFSAFHKAIDFDGGAYGLGCLVNMPTLDVTFELLESNGFEQRIYQKISIKIGERTASFYNTHLSFEDTKTRKDQMAYLKRLLDEDEAEFKIVTGDFNIEDRSEFELFLEEYQIANGHNGVWHDTFPGEDCVTHQLDNIILSKNLHINEVGMVKNNYSDHCMLWVDVSD